MSAFLYFFRSGTKWAHVSCALWIPEVSIGCAEKMEPITKISHIPVSRNLNKSMTKTNFTASDFSCVLLLKDRKIILVLNI